MKTKLAVMVPFGALLVVAAAVLCVIALTPVVGQAEEKAEPKKTEIADQKLTGITYTYVAQPGDSYSKIARKAVQTYGLKYKVNLSGAQILFAETKLTIEAGAPEINQGQTIKLNESKVKGWVEEASRLSDAQKKAWNVYTNGVDFNTDRVGEAQ